MHAYSPDSFDSETNIGRLISRVRHAMLSAVDARLAPLDLTASQWGIVVYLAEGIASTPAELSQLLDYDRGAMTRLLDRLEAKDIIRRSPSAEDRRSISLALTETGRGIYPEIRPLVVEVLNDMLIGFTPSEVVQLQGFLQRMLRVNVSPA